MQILFGEIPTKGCAGHDPGILGLKGSSQLFARAVHFIDRLCRKGFCVVARQSGFMLLEKYEA